ncbi:sugar-binding domain-containing protein [Melioribacter sp. OK-6-Me]|uniref:sugar-binding domain-containing protein n=1 Tax=unclassified Melioribacter TaxID=2627329 RepID=UPI003ED8D4EE
MKKKFYMAISFVFLLLSCSNEKIFVRDEIDLSGVWQFQLDPENAGIEKKWYDRNLIDSISLPGTTDSNKKGFLNTDTTTLHLNREFKYEGAAWYRKKIIVPENFKGKHIELMLERTKPSMLWIDDKYIGNSFLLQSPQHYDISNVLTPGTHFITLRIDNDLKLTPYGNVHIYSDDTQTNWNGIIGKIYIESCEKTFIKELRVQPEINKNKAEVIIGLENGLKLSTVDIELNVAIVNNGVKDGQKSVEYKMPADSVIRLEYIFEDAPLLWDEYNQPLYELTVLIKSKKIIDSKTVKFGMREFRAERKQFSINGRKTFLRGKHEAAVFPLTGFTPTDVESWMRVFKIAKAYGINHYRFHSYCPPEAAFEAADRIGIYLQAELPFWGGLESDSIASKLKAEGIGILRSYANHPSFVMLGAGNEIWAGHDRIAMIISELKSINSSLLYTTGANNNIGYRAPDEISDYYIGARTPYLHDTTLTHLRLSQAFADSKDGGILNSFYPSTQINFDYPVSQISIPVISHEVGQYQIYPDYNEIIKYTGVLKPWNLEVFRKRMIQNGLAGMDKDFQKASGAWSAICYKAEIEAALRTKDLAGFQLLDLQDFPGQGTALVGILDAFMESKNVVSIDNWKQSCNDVVLLAEFPKYCWRSNESFLANIKIANYSNKEIIENVEWELTNGKEVIASGKVKNYKTTPGKLSDAGKIKTKLFSETPVKLNLKLNYGHYKNEYPLWVYPSDKVELNLKDIIVTDRIDDKISAELRRGKKVLLFPDHKLIKEKSVEGLFIPDFWNYGMFKQISEMNKRPVSPGTLGILTDPDHPLFNNFPTDFHTNWQWFSIIKASRPLILNKLTDYKPIVSMIDNLERNYRLGLIFEFKVGNGSLLVCMSNLNKIKDYPEAYNLYKSILNYMQSDKFNPSYRIDERQLKELF